MSNEIKEKLDTHDQVLDQLIAMVDLLGKRDYPDYKQSTADLKQAALDVKGYLSEVKGQVDKLLAMKIKYSLDIKSRAVIIILSVWGLFTCLSVGLNISQHADNNTLEANAFKYRLMRQYYPALTDQADSIYMANPETVQDTVIKLEDKAAESAHAQAVAAEKAQDAKDALKEAKTLKKQTIKARKEALSGSKTKH